VFIVQNVVIKNTQGEQLAQLFISDTAKRRNIKQMYVFSNSGSDF